MKKALVCIASIILILTTLAFAAEKPRYPDRQSSGEKVGEIKTAKMNARGKVVEITDTAIKIERILKESTEIMEFALENPVSDITVNDFVKIDYSDKDGKWTAVRVAKLNGGKKSGKNVPKQKNGKPAAASK